MPNLVGIGNSQTPTNAMLGGLAYQDSVDVEVISKVKARTADTARDIFVYDTRKDSDGGAWRKRTKNTTWYNEKLGKRDRGIRREFPAVAVIVATASEVIIYDGDDPNLPLWMLFDVQNTTWLKHSGSPAGPNAVVAMNGYMVTCGQGNTGRLSVVNFVADDGYVTETSYTYRHQWISTRNTTSVGAVDTVRPVHILNNWCFDVAIHVMPNAVVDHVTGLQVPTIAVGTDSGVNIIHDNQRISYITGSNSTYNGVSKLAFTPDHRIAWCEFNSPTGGNYGWMYIHPVYQGNITQTLNTTGTSQSWYDSRNPLSFSDQDGHIFSKGNYIGQKINEFEIGNNIMYLSMSNDNTGVTLIRELPFRANRQSSLAYIMSDTTSGWLFGDIQWCTLSNTIANGTTDLVSADDNLITGQNHDYDTDTSENWTSQPNATAVHDASNGVGGGGCIKMDSNGGSNIYSTIEFTGLTVGKQYSIRFQAKHSAGGVTSNAYFSTSHHNTGTQYHSISFAPPTSYRDYQSLSFISQSTSVWMSVYANNGGSGFLYLDEFFLLESVADVTYKRLDSSKYQCNGFALYGNLKRVPVAHGAELIGYRGFNTGNFIKQNYDSNQNVGTGDFHIMYWIKVTNNATAQCIFHRGDGDASGWGSGPIIQIEHVGGNHRFFCSSSAFSNNDVVDINEDNFPTDVWKHVCMQRSSGKIQVFVDGEIKGTAASTRNMTNTSANVWIGNRPYQNRPLINAHLALFRFSKTAIPRVDGIDYRSEHSEEIKRIFNDEKKFFDKDAKCTLYGTSNRVEAIGVDTIKDVASFGTSAGRSDFSGLSRINNTTTAVTTAISASDGLIAEQ